MLTRQDRKIVLKSSGEMVEAHPKQDFLIIVTHALARTSRTKEGSPPSDVTINVMPYLDYCSRIASL